MKIFFFSLLLIILFFIFYTVHCFIQPREVEEIIIEIKQGESAKAITDNLFEHKIINHKNLFYFYVKFSGKSKHLSYGKYLFKGSYSLLEVIEQIKEGRIYLRKITIPEGFTIKKTCNLLSRAGLGDFKTFYDLCHDPEFCKDLTGMKISKLEGFLYPETYFFPEKSSEEFIIKHLVKEFFKQTSEIFSMYNEDQKFYNDLILSSIVEKEAQKEKEKPLIASVYLNRIKHGGYRLQADPTIAYALEKIGKKREKIYFKDLEINSPYNTYKHAGLPPTPICSPTLSSLKAILYPEESNYYFFFANGKGGHIFSRTFTEHQEKQRLLKNQL